MSNTLMGIPVEILTVVCFAIAVAYANFWPRPPRTATAPRSAVQQFVLRWFHAATWAFLGIAAFSVKYISGTAAQAFGLLGLASYFVFMTYFVREKVRYPQG